MRNLLKRNSRTGIPIEFTNFSTTNLSLKSLQAIASPDQTAKRGAKKWVQSKSIDWFLYEKGVRHERVIKKNV